MRKRNVVIVILILACIASEVQAACDFSFAALPYTASSPGTHCLASDVSYGSTSGNAVTVTVDGVTLDLQSHSIAAPTNLSTSAVGIRVLGHSDVVVRNGSVRGFQYGIVLDGPTHRSVVSGVTAASNTLAGIFVGHGSGNLIRDCSVTNTGGTTWTTSFTFGIWSVSTGTVIESNRVTGTVPASGGSAIGISSGGFGAIVGNTVLGLYTGGTCYGLGFEDVYRDNTARGCATSYSGGVAGPANFP